jgi:TonB family protein
LPKNSSVPRVFISKLSPPTYPGLALQARITGSVELNIAVRLDGSVQSIALVSGPPMLKAAAIESVQRREFECKDCHEPSLLYPVTYKFELGDALYCKGIDANGYRVYKPSADTQ